MSRTATSFISQIRKALASATTMDRATVRFLEQTNVSVTMSSRLWGI